MFETFTNFEATLLVSVIPLAFAFMWSLITGDFLNFAGSRTKVMKYTAKDPVNCYQNYRSKKAADNHERTKIH